MTRRAWCTATSRALPEAVRGARLPGRWEADGKLFVRVAVVARFELVEAVRPLLDHTRFYRRLLIEPVPREDIAEARAKEASPPDEAYAVWLHDGEVRWQVEDAEPDASPP